MCKENKLHNIYIDGKHLKKACQSSLELQNRFGWMVKHGGFWSFAVTCSLTNTMLNFGATFKARRFCDIQEKNGKFVGSFPKCGKHSFNKELEHVKEVQLREIGD